MRGRSRVNAALCRLVPDGRFVPFRYLGSTQRSQKASPRGAEETLSLRSSAPTFAFSALKKSSPNATNRRDSTAKGVEWDSVRSPISYRQPRCWRRLAGDDCGELLPQRRRRWRRAPGERRLHDRDLHGAINLLPNAAIGGGWRFSGYGRCRTRRRAISWPPCSKVRRTVRSMSWWRRMWAGWSVSERSLRRARSVEFLSCAMLLVALQAEEACAFTGTDRARPASVHLYRRAGHGLPLRICHRGRGFQSVSRAERQPTQPHLVTG